MKTKKIEDDEHKIQDLIHDAGGHDGNLEYWIVSLVNLHWQEKY